MVFRKRRIFKKRTSRKPSLVSKVNFLSRKVMNLDKSRERKFIQALATTPSALNNPNWDHSWAYHITSLAQGDANYQRSGCKISLERIHMRLKFYLIDGQTYTFACNIRVVVVQDKQTQTATIPSYTDIFANANFNSTYNLVDQPDRFTILYDKIFPYIMPYSGYPGATYGWNAENLNACVYHKFTLSRFDHSIFYEDSGVDDIQKNGLFMYICVDNDYASGMNIETYQLSPFTDS